MSRSPLPLSQMDMTNMEGVEAGVLNVATAGAERHPSTARTRRLQLRIKGKVIAHTVAVVGDEGNTANARLCPTCATFKCVIALVRP